MAIELSCFVVIYAACIRVIGLWKTVLSTLKPAGEVAEEQYSLMLLSTAIMVLVIIVVTIIFIFVILRFRRRKGEENVIQSKWKEAES